MQKELLKSSGIGVNKLSPNEKLVQALRGGKPLVRSISEYIEAEQPELLKLFYPRIYENLGPYHSPKTLSTMLASALWDIRRSGVENCPVAITLLSTSLQYFVDKKVPTLFIAPQLLEAVKRTDFAQDIDWTEMKLPYEHGVLMLPRNSLVHPSDGEVSFIIWSRIRPEIVRCPSLGIPDISARDLAFAMLAFCHLSGTWYDSTFNADHGKTFQLRNLFYRNAGELTPGYESDHPCDSNLDLTDTEFLEEVGVVALGTLLAISARPQLLEPAKRLKVVKAREGTKEFWTPNVVGRAYRERRESLGGTHASPRMHWRRGHFRQQHFGIGRKEVKTIWIEPCLVAAGETNERTNQRNST